MLLLGLDLETTGLDKDNDLIIEVGMVMWDSALRQPTRLEGFMVKPTTQVDPAHWAEAEKAHGLAWETVDRYGMPDSRALDIVDVWMQTAEVVVAHNGCAFDRLFIGSWFARNERTVPDRLWIDTRTDLPRPLTGKLIYLAAEHGFLNPFPHRAVFDAMTMMKILDTYDVDAVVERAKLPNIMVQALVSFDDKDKAKERGYQWTKYQGQKERWLRTVKDPEVAREQQEAPFKILVLGRVS